MNENAEIMDKLRDNGLSEEVNKRIADVYSRVPPGLQAGMNRRARNWPRPT